MIRTYLRWLALPVSALWYGVLWMRNRLYDKGWLKATQPDDVLTLVVGNLNLGGTGKTPATEWLIQQLHHQYRLGVLSRGYGRKTAGFRWIDNQSTADQVGDEPLQMFQKCHTMARFAVDGNRLRGIRAMKKAQPDLELILLDDAFQHRALRADYYLLLTPYELPFWEDFLLPVGGLRDIHASARRADMIWLTKAPQLGAALPQPFDKPIFISTIGYLPPKPVFGEATNWSEVEGIFGLCGIAKPSYFEQHLRALGMVVRFTALPDHRDFTLQDLMAATDSFDNFAHRKAALCITEKDWTKLKPLVDAHQPSLNIWVIPIEMQLNQPGECLADIVRKLERKTKK
ncbi:MAG TPA: tetraacyldisaccharide 4'-kinase [Luteibaculaceae bacterium]|nr:tetraacyldisaccharide 4'-kinase [Luteibaculaceae bacterium]